jgi:hypothetical protein
MDAIVVASCVRPGIRRKPGLKEDVMVARSHNQQDGDDFFDVDDLDVDARELTEEEGRRHFDEAARRELGISGEEFLRRWDAGEYQPIPDTPEGWKVGRLYMMMPFVRPTRF